MSVLSDVRMFQEKCLRPISPANNARVASPPAAGFAAPIPRQASFSRVEDALPPELVADDELGKLCPVLVSLIDLTKDENMINLPFPPI